MDHTINYSKKASWLYLGITLGVYVVMTAVFLLFPRTKFSELEKRSLAEAPSFSLEALANGNYAADMSHWFNDTEPFRDRLMELSMIIRGSMRQNFGETEAIIVHNSDDKNKAEEEDEAFPDLSLDQGVGKIAHRGIVIVGSGSNVRALMSYGGVEGGNELVRVAKRYATEMPSVKIYEMIAPLASEFYMPTKVKSASKPQITTIDNIRKLTEGSAVRHVDAYTALLRHADKDIYLRTDHHWAPLGAYYAAQTLAKSAGVPFKPLDGFYDKKTIHGFVGTMYGYSQDISVKNAPEDFVYYVPNKVQYTTTYRQYSLNADFAVTGESAPFQSSFFKTFKDGSGAAYSTFMGGDSLLAVVSTDTNNGRRLLIIKDSYGNAVPGFLFYSFEEIHIVDFRYFTHNMRNYCAANKITDLAIIFNVFNAYSTSSASRIEKFLTQGEGIYASSTPGHKNSTKESGETPKDDAQIPNSNEKKCDESIGNSSSEMKKNDADESPASPTE